MERATTNLAQRSNGQGGALNATMNQAYGAAHQQQQIGNSGQGQPLTPEFLAEAALAMGGVLEPPPQHRGAVVAVERDGCAYRFAASNPVSIANCIAVECLRGAAHVTVVARRLGTICPKMIDYLNFVKPWDAHYRHETATNVKQLKAWRDTYTRSGAATPEVWPGKIKHDGHTISVSDVWWVGHHMGKLTTRVGELSHLLSLIHI